MLIANAATNNMMILPLRLLPICRRGKINRKHILILVLLQYQIMDGIMTSAAYPSPKEGKIFSIIEYTYPCYTDELEIQGKDATGNICLGVSQLGICKTTYSIRDKKVALISYQPQRRSAISTGFIFKWANGKERILIWDFYAIFNHRFTQLLSHREAIFGIEVLSGNEQKEGWYSSK